MKKLHQSNQYKIFSPNEKSGKGFVFRTSELKHKLSFVATLVRFVPLKAVSCIRQQMMRMGFQIDFLAKCQLIDQIDAI